MSIEAMKKALGAIEGDLSLFNIPATARMLEAITALRTAIEQAEKQEPVAWGIIASNTGRICRVELDADEVEDHNPKHIVPLYTTPPAAQPAPDLLNALKRIVDEPNNTMSDGKALKEIIRIARAAISKATGEQA